MKKLTIAQIAELAGVSKATVSRVLNNYPHISPAVREKVQQVIAETGYQPNNIARMLASERSNIIGLLVPSDARKVFTDPYYPTLTEGVSRGAHHHNLTLSLFIVYTPGEGLTTIRNIISAGLLDGLIITADDKNYSHIELLVQSQLPFVLIGNLAHIDGIPCRIDVDNVDGGRTATEHLINLGYQRVATIASNKNLSGEERLQGYRQALEAHGRPFEPDLVVYGDYSAESAYIAMQRLLALDELPDAIFIASDSMAIGAMRAIREAGLQVPDDVAIVGFDDLPTAVQTDPPLTTIHQPIDEVGRLAVSTLLDLADNPETTPREIILPTKLVIRATCGAVKNTII
ncbi:MAG: LacI family transcriptional regulator [Chloroflexi bacterium]|nr:MAG: LacI family transcriptional regulator [Chloroflexota bacterium]